MLKYNKNAKGGKVKMQKDRKKHLFSLIILNLSLLLVSFIYNILFERGKIGNCQFYQAFGLYCPGCGGSRSLNALLNFSFIKSFVYYPPIIITSLLILYIDTRLILSLFSLRRYKFNPKILLIIPLSIIVSFIIRYILLGFGIDPLGSIL